MLYAKEEKRMLDNIVTAFDDYIQAQDFFDLLYSKKLGYVWLHVEESDEGMTVIRTVDKLLDALFTAVILDVHNSQHRENDCFHLTEEELCEVRQRLTQILQATGPDADFCFNFLDAFLKNCTA